MFHRKKTIQDEMLVKGYRDEFRSSKVNSYTITIPCSTRFDVRITTGDLYTTSGYHFQLIEILTLFRLSMPWDA